MRKTTKLLVLVAVLVAIFALSFTVSAQTTNGWDENPDGTWSYYENGSKVCDSEIYDNGKYYRLDENGIMLESEWYEDDWGIWHYYGVGGAAYADCVAKIGSYYYGFDLSGYLYDDALFEIYDEVQQESYTYYASPVETNEGRLLTSQWKEFSGYYYFFSSTAAAFESGSYNMGGKWYGFDQSGRMFEDGDFWLSFTDNDVWKQRCYRADADGVLVTNHWEQLYLADGDTSWYYFGNDGGTYAYGAYEINGKYYGFDQSGVMYDDTSFSFGYWDEATDDWINTGAYRAKAGGVLYVNEWYETDWGSDYYYGAGGKAAYGAVSVDGKCYLFDENGYMLTHQALEVKTANGYECYYADENGYAISLPNNKWTELDDIWYYVQNGRLCKDGVYKIGGAYYCFYSAGQLVVDSVYETEDKIYGCNADGVAKELANNSWTKIGEDWYYVKDGVLCEGDVYTIDSVAYYFYWGGRMADDDLIYADYYDEDLADWVYCRYYAKPGGALAKNLWFEYEGSWRYAGDDYGVYNDGLTKIGSYYYYFYDWYAAAQNTVVTAEDGVYVVGDNCRATKANGWFKHPSYDEWMYANGTELYSDGIYEIGGKKYAFDWEGFLTTNTIQYDYNTGYYYLINSDGEVVTTYGWQKMNGSHYFVNSDATLAEGWLLNGGTWYYMQPAMSYCDIIVDENCLYATNVNGEYKKITANGFYNVTDRGVVFLKNGTIVLDDWVKVNGEWYYFSDYGSMYSDDVYNIEDVLYYFNVSGAMADNGWVRTSDGSWVWADSNGKLFTGKDSAGYIFDDRGYLQVNETVYVGSTWYVTNSDGKAVSSLKNNDWTYANGYWYFVEDGELMTGGYIDDKDDYYYFDYQGRMMSGGIYGSHFLNASGEARTGWIKYDGKWYYADPDDYGYLYTYGIYEIDGKDYYFHNKVLQQNVTVQYGGKVITTDAEGIVTKEVEPNGWTYFSLGSSGNVYYYKDGKPYTGWVGDYYIEEGYLKIDEMIDYQGETYYVGADGRYIRNGWYEIWGDYVFARGDGSLAKDEWIATNNGKYWYYFDDIFMVADRVITIDGVKHAFNADGVWTGEYKASSYKDGWQKIGSKWYFYMAGEKVRYREIYDNGKWYYVDYNGVMVTNSFENANYNYGGYYYYGSDGARVNYTGWKKINGKWSFFDNNSCVTEGWIFDGKNYYYQEWYYEVDADGETTENGICMVTGYVVSNDVLYYFGSDGKYVKPITATGWYDFNGDWYYVENGYAVRGEGMYRIGNDYYAFDYSGRMVSNNIYDGRFYGADGKMVTTAGWRYIAETKNWIYINDNGYVAMWGIFKIDGKEYVFDYGVWIA